MSGGAIGDLQREAAHTGGWMGGQRIVPCGMEARSVTREGQVRDALSKENVPKWALLDVGKKERHLALRLGE